MAFDPTHFDPNRRYRTEAPCAGLIEDVAALAALGPERSHQEGTYKFIGCTCLLLAAATPAGILALLHNPEPAPLWPNMACPILASLGLFVLFTRPTRRAFELEARRSQLVTQLLRLLGTDIAARERVVLDFDMRPESHSDKLVGTNTTGSGWKARHYLDPWLRLEGRLLDGNGFRVDVTERVELRGRQSRSSSGRLKRKTKRLSDALIRVRLRVPPEQHPHLSRLGEKASGAVKLPEGTRLKSLRVEGDHLDLTVRVEQPWRARDAREPSTVYAPLVVAMCFLSLYQLLHLSQVLTRRALPTR